MPVNSVNTLSFKGAQGIEPNLQKKYHDDELFNIASEQTFQRLADVSKKTAKTVLIAVPVVDSVLGAAVQNGPLSSKIAKSASILGKWGVAFATAFAVFGIKKAVNNKAEKLDRFDKKYPVLSFGIDFAALLGGLTLVNNAGLKISNIVKANFLKVKDKLAALKKPIKSALNNNFVNKKMVQTFDNFLAKHPYHSAASKAVAFLAAPAIAVAALIRLKDESIAAVRNTTDNYSKLMVLDEIFSSDNSIKKSEIDEEK